MHFLLMFSIIDDFGETCQQNLLLKEPASADRLFGRLNPGIRLLQWEYMLLYCMHSAIWIPISL